MCKYTKCFSELMICKSNVRNDKGKLSECFWTRNIRTQSKVTHRATTLTQRKFEHFIFKTIYHFKLRISGTFVGWKGFVHLHRFKFRLTVVLLSLYGNGDRVNQINERADAIKYTLNTIKGKVVVEQKVSPKKKMFRTFKFNELWCIQYMWFARISNLYVDNARHSFSADDKALLPHVDRRIDYMPLLLV